MMDKIVLSVTVAEPIAFLAIAPLIMMTYGIIITPAMMSLSSRERTKKSTLVRYISFILCALVVASVCVFLLGIVVSHYPWLIAPQFRAP